MGGDAPENLGQSLIERFLFIVFQSTAQQYYK